MSNTPFPPSPPLLSAGKLTARLPGKMASQPYQGPFTVHGTTKEDRVFEFHDIKDNPGSISLKPIIRHCLGLPRLSSVPVYDLYKILGKLRGLHHISAKHNEGIQSPLSAFSNYWTQKFLDLLSGYGFRLSCAKDTVHIQGLEELIRLLETTYHDDIQVARNMIELQSITFEALGELYRPGVSVVAAYALEGTTATFLVTESFYQENRGMAGVQKTFNWKMDFVANIGQHFTVVSVSEQLIGWTGIRARSLSELTYILVSPNQMEESRHRGEQYANYASGGAKFLAYARASFFRHAKLARPNYSSLASNSSSQLHSAGRVMIDTSRGASLGHHACQGMDEPTLALVKITERYRHWCATSSAKGSGTEALVLWDAVPTELLPYCWPALVGFSFTAKCWGHVLVSGLSPIQFQDTAFERLVIAEERKQLIRALVRFGNDLDVGDIIGSKRGGSIFLLHGPPGVGKTLTAEAVAEFLHRPIYYVTMGELGTTAEDMERRVTDVLELCSEWNAITILDEADVFLEQRRTSDLVRNSMVCVLLRLLEYHSGILFLTTNRVRTLDPAFESRITLALRYERLTHEARAQIWTNLLKHVPLQVANDIKPLMLGCYELNGRQIKSAIRLGCAIVRERQQSELTQKTLEEVLEVIEVGREGIMKDESWKMYEK